VGNSLYTHSLEPFSLEQPGLEAVIFSKAFCIFLAQGLGVEGDHVLSIECVWGLAAYRDSISAVELYRKAGYLERELVRNYYGRGNHAVRMWKNLDVCLCLTT